MSKVTIIITKCDRCGLKQSDENPIAPDRRLLDSIAEIKVHIPFLSAVKKYTTEFPYDWDKNSDLCPKCRKELRNLIDNFIRNYA